MNENNLEAFSTHRLNGEPVPEDVKILLANADELLERTGIALNWEEDWSPWLDTSYLSESERANPDIAANVRSIAAVSDLVAFIAVYEDQEYFGYWRGEDNRAIVDSPLIRLDNEAEFEYCGGSNFAEAILGQVYDAEDFIELCDWFRSLGISVLINSLDDLTYPEGDASPTELHKTLYYQYRRETGLS